MGMTETEVLIRQLRIALGIYNDDSKHIIELVEALQAELDKHRWIPVEEGLPKNQKRVDVYYFNELGKIRVTVAEYIPEETILAEDYLSDECPEKFHSKGYDKENDCYWTPEGWYESTYHGDINWYIGEKIIGWRPITLPESEVK